MLNLCLENIFIKFKYKKSIISNMRNEDLKLITLFMEMLPCLTISFDGKLFRVVKLRLLLYKVDLLLCVPITINPVWLNNINRRERELNNQQSNCFIFVCVRVCVQGKETEREEMIKKNQSLNCVYSLRLM